MRYSVVMLTMAGREPSMRLALQKVRAGASTPPDDYEIVVVNNGGSALAARHPASRALWLEDLGGPPFLRVIDRPTNEGVCARNHGISAANGEFIIQVDDDVLVTPGFDEVLLAPYENPRVGATGQEGFYQDSTWGLLIDDRRRPRPGQFCDLVMGYCWSWRNLRAPYFDGKPNPHGDPPGDARFLYDWDFSPFWHEESDLQLQIRAVGYRIMMIPPVATHRSLHDWQETHTDGPLTGKSIAERNFLQLIDKWRDKDIRFEGPSVGLVGPAPGKRIAQ